MAFSKNKIHFHGNNPSSDSYKGSSASKYNKAPDLYCAFSYGDPTVNNGKVTVRVNTCWLLASSTDGASTFFGFSIKMRAILGSSVSNVFINKPASDSTWGSNDYKLNAPFSITADIPSSGKIHFAIQVMCENCGCTAGQNTWQDVVGQDLSLGYTITWDAQGGHFADGSSTKKSTNVPAGADMSKYEPDNPSLVGTVDGWYFDRWTTDVTGNTTIPAKTEAKNVTYYAQYYQELVVHFNYNNGTDGTIRSEWNEYVSPGDSVTFKYTLTRSGYEFAGWKDETDGTIYPNMDVTISNIQRRYNLTAQWNRLVTGQLHYDTQGGTPIPLDQDLTDDPASRKINDRIIPEKKIKIRFRVVETGGSGPNPNDVTLTMPLDYYSPDRGSVKYQPGDSVPQSWKQGTLTAIYKNATFTSMSLPPDPTHPEGLRFIGWATQTSGYGNIGTKSSNILPITLSSDTTYYAIWEQKLEYDPNGAIRKGGNPGSTDEYTRVDADRNAKLADGAQIFPDCAWPFLGWDEDPDVNTPTYAKGDTYRGSGGVLYAIWKRPDVKVTFEYTGGYDGSNSKGPKTVTVRYGGSATPPSGMHWVAKPGEKRYSFAGWIGKYRNVTYDTTVRASWEYSPVYIWTGDQWIAYFAGVALTEWRNNNA